MTGYNSDDHLVSDSDDGSKECPEVPLICKLIAAACCCCCCCVVALGLGCVLLFWNFTVPEFGVDHVYFKDVSVTTESVVFHLDVQLWIMNPNDWPFTAELEEVEADTWSLKNITREGGTEKEPIELGRGTLAAPFKIETQANSTFNVFTDVKVGLPKSGILAPRLKQDCCIYGNTTLLKVKLLKGVVKLGGHQVGLPQIEVEDIPVPCGDMFEPTVCATMRGEAGVSAGSNGATAGGNSVPAPSNAFPR